MMIIGVDASLTSTGFSYRSRNGGVVTGRIQPKGLRDSERLDYIGTEIDKAVERVRKLHGGVDLMALEGYAMGKRMGRFFDIGELGGVIKTLAYRRGIDVLLVPPTNLKVFAVGSSRIPDKSLISAAVKDVWGYDIPQHDEADAFVLMAMGEALRSKRKLGGRKREALSTCRIILGSRCD